MKITITHNGFHGRHDVSFLDDKPVRIGDPADDIYEAQVSLRTARRLNNIVCVSANCRCGEHVADEITYRNQDGTGFATVTYVSEDGGKTGEIKGNYPNS